MEWRLPDSGAVSLSEPFRFIRHLEGEPAVIRLGAIADDFTGATDLATSLRERGLRVAVVLGAEAVPSVEEAADLDAVIVALKSRTAPVGEAVGSSIASIRALEPLHPEQYFVKYCSTFDSTPTGNIGPILDAVLDEVGESRTVVVPAFPDNGRTVFRGHLFVHDQLLDESPMRHHPLTPMNQSRLAGILAPQTARAIAEVTVDAVWQGAAALSDALEALPRDTSYVVVDATTNADLETIQAATAGWRVLSGSAGLAFGMRGEHDPASQRFDVPTGRRLVVCGSASAKTRAQIADALEAGASGHQLDIERLLGDPDAVVDDVLAWLSGLPSAALPVVYSVASLDDVRSTAAGEAVEAALSALVSRAVAELGVRQVIVAGGETSGAVTTALGCRRLLIGPQIAPGVCWSLSQTSGLGTAHDGPAPTVALALKSGNFGADDLFTTAWKALS
ncbi:3-oxo-tetronate kinase [Herbiconiux sp.]|uniref:3-oxo-tetronate kinase n=1 Tax=Herbiconiux sp. TaxID=1871186 RepID=UPI0025C4B266|nr:3-oxo-tetronate kinase [Herbiconiux sp.]